MIQSDASKSRWSTFCNGVSLKNKRTLHVNVLKLIPAKFAVLTFTKVQSNIAIHLQIDNKTALSYLLKMNSWTSASTFGVTF